MALPPSCERWSTRDTQKLLARMEESLPSNDSSAFLKTQSNLDWAKIAFEDFTGEICRQKWMEIFQNLRKVRSLTELVLEAKEQVKSPQESMEYKKHPDFPKRPLTAYLRFYKEQRAQYCQMHPELNKKQLTKILSEKYKQLPEQVRQRYVQEFQKERRDYKKKVARFKIDNPKLVQNSKQSVVRAKPQTYVPKQLQGKMNTMRSPTKMHGLPPKMKFLGEHKKPPMNGYHRFYQEWWSSKELRYLPKRDRMVEISRRWQLVLQSMKEHSKSQAEEMEKEDWKDLDAWFRKLSLEEEAAHREVQATHGNRKRKVMTEGPAPKFRRSDLQSLSDKTLPELHSEERGTDSSETSGVQHGDHQGPEENVMEDGKEDEVRRSSDTSRGDGDEDGNSEDIGYDSDIDSM